MKEQAYYLSLEDCDFYSKRQRLNSPRSIEALRRLGILESDLFYQDFYTFKSNHPEIAVMSKDIQALRYEHHEATRQQYVDAAIKQREKIIDENYPNIKKNEKSKFQNDELSQNSTQLKSTAIEQEKRALEKIKQKQKQEIQNLIENEIKMTMIRQENEEKLMKQREKEELNQMQLLERRRMQEKERIKKQKEKEQQQMMEYYELQRKNQEKYLEEQQKAAYEEEQERQKKKERIKNAKRQQSKQEEFRRKTERIFSEQQNRIKDRQNQMEERERIRQEQLERKKIEMINENKKKGEISKNKLITAKMNLQEKLESQKSEFEKKAEKEEEKRRMFERSRQESLRRQKEESLKRQAEINEILEKNKSLEKQKVIDYMKKQEEIENQKKMLERIAAEKQKQKKQELIEKEKKNEEIRKRNEMLEMEKGNSVLKKINQQENKLNDIKYKEILEARMEKEKAEMKRNDKKKTIQRISMIQQYEKEKNLQSIIEKTQKAEEFKNQKNQMLNKRKDLAGNVNKQKKVIIEKFEETMKKNKGISADLVKELFPGEEGEALLEKINLLNNKSKELSKTGGIGQNSKANSNSSNKNINKTMKNDSKSKLNPVEPKFNQTQNLNKKFNHKEENMYGTQSANPLFKEENIEGTCSGAPENNFQPNDSNISSKRKKKDEKDLKPLPEVEYIEKENQSVIRPKKENISKKEEEILKKIEMYRQKLNKELMILLDEDKKIAKERTETYNILEDPVEKRRLEKIIAMEKAMQQQKIVKFNQDIDKKMLDYEYKLRSNS